MKTSSVKNLNKLYERPQCFYCYSFETFAGTRSLHYGRKELVIDIYCKNGHKWKIRERYDKEKVSNDGQVPSTTRSE